MLARFKYKLLFAVPWLLLAFLSVAQEININVGFVAENPELVARVTAVSKEKNCVDIEKYSYNGSTRTYAEAILICQALQLGGITPVFNLVHYHSYGRALKDVNGGKLHFMFSTSWLEEAEPDNVYISSSFMNKREFEKGFYVLANNKELLQVKTLADLKPYTILSNEHYAKDWAALIEMNVHKYSVPHWGLMFKMLKLQRGDIILAEFAPSSNMFMYSNDAVVAPILGIKISFNSSRHLLINKSQPNSLLIFNALQAGLQKLNANTRIFQAYQELGFYNQKIKNWKTLCCN